MTGKYDIIEMPEFDDVYLGIEVDPFIEIKDGGASFQFGLVAGFIEFTNKNDSEKICFKWQGSDEMDEVWGSGMIKRESENILHGYFTFNNGDKYDFKATKQLPC